MKLMRFSIAILLLVTFCTLSTADQIWAQNDPRYDRMDPLTSKIRQADGTVGSWWDQTLQGIRVVIANIMSCEDQANQLCRVSGGPVRTTTFSSVTSAASSSITSVPTGTKTFMGQIINATSETKAVTALIYGNWTNSTTGGILLCTLTLPSTVTVLQLQDACPVVTANFAFYYYTVSVYTSASSAPFKVYAMY